MEMDHTDQVDLNEISGGFEEWSDALIDATSELLAREGIEEKKDSALLWFFALHSTGWLTVSSNDRRKWTKRTKIDAVRAHH